ncbi:unnamed protein product [Menidia menidia]|uniref:(Atlantic silverside) hypothetical protein n=1 Tax=Menidia menidia TaxID=238744 RepID=A0A8S4BHV6_9TELE|nr:unnamed protein product [Menidia menidia]
MVPFPVSFVLPFPVFRLTAQRSVEDAEEIERERRRRAREALRQGNGAPPPGEPSPERGGPAENMFDSDLKPNGFPSLDEDEGFSDWTQLRERRRQQRLQELNQGAEEEEEEEEEEDTRKKSAPTKAKQLSNTAFGQTQREDRDETDTPRKETEKKKEFEKTETEKSGEEKEEEQRRMTMNASIPKRSNEIQRAHTEVAKRKEVKVSYTSKVLLRQEVKHGVVNGDGTTAEVTSHTRKSNRSNSVSSDGDETFSPFSPKVSTHKITERTESLNRSLKKSNSFKKTQPLVLLAKIDDRMEQYAHAVENSQEPRPVRASLSDLPNSPEVVSSTKGLFEAGEAWSQSPSKGPTCKDTEGLKVGVASLITHWVKGSSDAGGKQLNCRPSDVKHGDVMQKKNMWEIIGDASGKPEQRNKGSTASKKYKFVVTGHGKYEKISVDDQ